MIALGLLLAAQLASTSSTAGLGDALASELATEIRIGTLTKQGAEKRFLALPKAERKECLQRWLRLVEPSPRAMRVYRDLEALIDGPVVVSSESPRPIARSDQWSKTRDAPSTPARSLALDREQLRLLNGGSKKHGFGAALILSGAASSIGGVALGIVAAESDSPATPAIVVGLVGLVELIVGVAVLGSGTDDIDAAFGG